MIEIRSGETSYFCVGPYLQVWGLEKRSGMAHCRARGPPRRAFPPATPGTGTVIGCSFGQPSAASVTFSHLWADRGARKSELRGVADHQNSPYVSRDRTSDVLERNRLQPTEALFDPLPFPLADLITVVPRGPRIDRASTVP